jgi:DNA-binding helix-hairpin-helix protein with protein kinase domain
MSLDTVYFKSNYIKDGGEGSIYEVKDHPTMLMKLYFTRDEVNIPPHQSKIEYMKSNVPVGLDSGSIAWPLDLVNDDNGRFIGFVMPKLKFDAMIKSVYCYKHPTYHSADYESYPSTKAKVTAAINICSLVNSLHSENIVVGDLNHENIGINHDNGYVCIVDCDSFHITNSCGIDYRTRAIMPGYLAPEIIDHCRGEQRSGRVHEIDKVVLPTFTKESDLFCLAIHIFKLLMNGVDPFLGVVKNAEGSNAAPFHGNDAIEQDTYVFGVDKRPVSVFCPPENSLPPQIQHLFFRAFVLGRKYPAVRPDAREWYTGLNNYLNSLTQCSKNYKHYYYNALISCPLCIADTLYEQTMNPAQSSAAFNMNGTVQSPNKKSTPVVEPVKTSRLVNEPSSLPLWSKVLITILVIAVVIVIATLIIIGVTNLKNENYNGLQHLKDVIRLFAV